eukprot:SAG11_NODE_107_length_16392_cov_18.393666_6_plen_71_part_00
MKALPIALPTSPRTGDDIGVVLAENDCGGSREPSDPVALVGRVSQLESLPRRLRAAFAARAMIADRGVPP